MSASNKKKLRREQEAASLTEKQLSAQKEAKKVKLYTIIFAVITALFLVVAIVAGVNQTLTSSGTREKNTVALTVNDHKLSSVEMNYFFVDAVNNMLNQYNSYASMFGMDAATLMGLDAATPLDQQVVDEETGRTWADNFQDSAKSSAQAAYALADAAKAEGFTLSDEDLASVDTIMSNMDAYAVMSGLSDGSAYIKAVYGNGSSAKSYREYVTLLTLASAYQQHHSDSLTYDDAALRAKDSEDPTAYTSYTYNTYYLAANRFLEGGTAGEDGTTTYTDAEKAAAVSAAGKAARELTADTITDVASLNAAISALAVNADSAATSTAHNATRFDSITEDYREWVTSASRVPGDKTYVASTSTDEDGKVTTDGYYAVLFLGADDNTVTLKNVRHILVSYQGGTTDETTGQTTYSDEEKAAAKAEAEQILADWKAGEATEDSFAALATEKSTDPGSSANGGLYENVFPGQMVANFNDWCFDAARKSGDTGVVETEYGCHVMYFVGDADQNYRDYLISSDLREADMEAWYQTLVESTTATEGDLRYVRRDMVLSRG